jgi:hypothetical protein
MATIRHHPDTPGQDSGPVRNGQADVFRFRSPEAEAAGTVAGSVAAGAPGRLWYRLVVLPGSAGLGRYHGGVAGSASGYP